jgi:hypothetical protein
MYPFGREPSSSKVFLPRSRLGVVAVRVEVVGDYFGFDTAVIGPNA